MLSTSNLAERFYGCSVQLSGETLVPISLVCEVCSTGFQVPPSRKDTAKVCSHACAVIFRGKARERRTELTCKQCSAVFEVPNCHASRRIYCSKACQEAAPETKTLKASRTGQTNSGWKGGKSKRQDGYVYALAGWHPHATNAGYVLEHRLVMERWLLQNDPASRFLVYCDGHLILSLDYEVHHKDEVRSHNDISNLECLTKSEHQKLHAKLRSERT